jgi:hypothetical protein
MAVGLIAGMPLARAWRIASIPAGTPEMPAEAPGKEIGFGTRDREALKGD